MGFLWWVWWFPTMGVKVAGFEFIFCIGVVVLVWVFRQRECENLLILLEGRVLGGVAKGDSIGLQKEVL